jgi:hypothetical protein
MKIKLLKNKNHLFFLFFFLSIFIGCYSVNKSVINDDIHLSRYDIENDMFLPHEGSPAGVPDGYNWRYIPRLGYGKNMPKDWNAITAWGQVFADKEQPNPNKDYPLIRVHIKDLQLFIYQNDGTWKMLQNINNPVGAHYVEDFIEDANKPAEIRNEKGGGISIQAGSGYNFHFYPEGRVNIDKNNIAGIFVVCKARLIGIREGEILPKYLISIGGDYWRSLTAEWKSDFSNNNDIGIGRFKYVTPEWDYFIMHTFSKEEVKSIVFPLE